MQIPHLAVLAVIVLPLLLLWIGAVVSIVRHEHTALIALWLIVTLVFPFLGPLAWFLVGRGVARSREPVQA